jgi:magnesium chelatase accessory protein
VQGPGDRDNRCKSRAIDRAEMDASPDAAISTPSGLARVPRDWANRDCSRSVSIDALEWHVQICGSGPTLVLLHGTGSSAHTWADLLPALARFATVVAPDLPGHGYTKGASIASLTLPRVAASLDKLLATLGVCVPAAVVGHSAGAALALRWALDSALGPRAILGFNPSLVAPPAAYTKVLGPLITPLATSAPVATLLVSIASRTRLVSSLLESTRSRIPEMQRQRYATLFRESSHIRGAMGLMAAADLAAIQTQGRVLKIPLAFVVGAGDKWVPERPLRATIERWFPAASVQCWAGGHLLHEEEPERAVATIREWLVNAAR